MKPRRWYSGPEVNPSHDPDDPHPFPEPIYWAFTTLTRLEQGPIIKSVPAGRQDDQQRRGAAPMRARQPRLIDAA